MKQSFVYLLVDADSSKNRFKIGHSVDPFSRKSSFPQAISLRDSRQISCAYDDAKNIERTLHFLFREYRIAPMDVEVGDGYTEWFRSDCLTDAVDFIERNQAKLRCGKLSEISRIERKSKEKPAPRRAREWTPENSRDFQAALAVSRRVIAMLVAASTDFQWEDKSDGRLLLTGYTEDVNVVRECAFLAQDARLFFPEYPDICDSISMSWSASGTSTNYRLRTYRPDGMREPHPTGGTFAASSEYLATRAFPCLPSTEIIVV